MKKLLFIVLLIINNLCFVQYIIGKHDSKVKEFANACAVKLQNQISPHTGQDAYGVVKEWIYDEYKDKYEIKLEAYWTAKKFQVLSDTDFVRNFVTI